MRAFKAVRCNPCSSVQTTYSSEHADIHVQNQNPVIRSDELPKLTALLRQISVLNFEVNLFQVDLILDANVVVRDLLWLARKRRNPMARTSVMELMDCEVVRAYAPHFLVREINANIPFLAEEHGIREQTLRNLWNQYRRRIKLVAVGGPAKDPSAIDPKDTPYLRLQKRLACPIVSEDAHIAAMGGNVVQIQVFSPLRAYSRNTAIEYHLKVTGVGSAMILAALGQAAVTLIQRLGTVPKPVLWGGIILVALLLAHPNSRKMIFEMGGQLARGGVLGLEAAFAALGPVIDQHATAIETARLNLAQAKSVLLSGSGDITAEQTRK